MPKTRKFPPSTKRFWLAGSFRSRDRANEFRNVLVDQGWEVKVTSLSGASSTRKKSLRHQVWIEQPKSG